MSNPRVEVLLWARRAVARKAAEPHVLLEVNADATVEQAQEAFHTIARMAHPDLHRSALSAEELELVTSAYAHVANAYQQFRTAKLQTTKVSVVKTAPPAGKPRGAAVTLPGGGVIRGSGTTRPPISTTNTPVVSRTSTDSAVATSPAAPAVLVPEPSPPASAHAAGQMNSKALVHYRKAEMALRRGDLRGGMLSLKMAIAADPQSTFLRSALTEAESELGKKP